jgi:hypothetical protein
VAVSDHFVQFFDETTLLVNTVSGFLERGLQAGEVCVVLSTSANLKNIAVSLNDRQVDLTALDAAYRYIPIDAEAMLSECSRDGRLNLHRLHARLDLLLRQAASQGRPVRIFGEIVDLLVDRGMSSSVIDLEELWNELGRSHDFVLFCAYSQNLRSAHRDSRLYERVCAIHHHTSTDRLH